MTRSKRSKTTPGARTEGLQPNGTVAVLPRWRWLFYLGSATAIVAIIFSNIGGVMPAHATSMAAWEESGELDKLAISGIFTALIVALIKIFLDPVFLGIAQRKSNVLIAKELAVSIAATAAGVAAEGLLSAAAGAGSGSDAPSGGMTSGNGGDFGGGGASGKF